MEIKVSSSKCCRAWISILINHSTVFWHIVYTKNLFLLYFLFFLLAFFHVLWMKCSIALLSASLYIFKARLNCQTFSKYYPLLLVALIYPSDKLPQLYYSFCDYCSFSFCFPEGICLLSIKFLLIFMLHIFHSQCLRVAYNKH